MAEVTVTDDLLANVAGKVIIVTGGSSGIGLATVKALLSLGATVIGTDLREPDPAIAADVVSSPHFTFHAASVTEWGALVGLFKKTLELHGRVDHVFANAGTTSFINYVDNIELDDNGDPKEPHSASLDVNLMGVINTATLAIHYMRKNPGDVGGSVVINASSTGLQRFRITDYAVSKHGVIGLMRGLHAILTARNVPVRVNAIAPSWTGTGMVSEELLKKIGIYSQTSDVVARGAIMLMADDSRRGHLIHIDHGVYKEVDEALMLPTYDTIRHKDTMNEDEAIGLSHMARKKLEAEGN